MPCGFVVKNGSKTFLRSPVDIPGPVSLILISALAPMLKAQIDKPPFSFVDVHDKLPMAIPMKIEPDWQRKLYQRVRLGSGLGY